MVVANVKMHEQAVKREQEVVLRNVNPVVEAAKKRKEIAKAEQEPSDAGD